MTVMIRNDQKFFEPALKNSWEENLPLSFLTLPNKPAVRKAFMTNPMNQTNIKPAEKNEKRLFKVEPRSAKTSISNPFASFSVIMLLPKAELNELLKG
jgi:hypothetical protein